MTIAVHLTVEPVTHADGSEVGVVLYAQAGAGKKREELHTFDKANPTWSGHMWKGRDLVLEEVELSPAHIKIDEPQVQDEE